MRRLWSMLIPAVVFIGYIYILRMPIPTASGTLPPPGGFMNPFSGFWQNAEPVRTEDLDFRLAGLNDAVQVIFDERLVPHIFSRNEEDLLHVQGYLHAKNRLWQMDITARQAAGRLAEVFGKNLLANDQRMRRMGLAASAASYAENWKNCEEYPQLENYVRGVNEFISELNNSEYPFEFKLFNYKPELWSIEKTALVVMSMNLNLCGRYEDLQATNALSFFGEKQFKEFYPRWNPKQSPVIPNDVRWDIKSIPTSASEPSIGYFPGRIINDSPRFIGSNSWAVDGTKTADGIPVLCNDPHLSLTLPSIWYELQMQSEQQNTYGVSIPGIPYIAIGFNDHIAWGETNVGMDVADLYEIKWLDDSELTYLLDEKSQKVNIRIENYYLKDGSVVQDTVKLTAWGPVFLEENRSVALHWLPNMATDNCIIGAFRKLNQAHNFSDFYQALVTFQSPAQNFIFASQVGDIAMKVQGALPIKPENEGQFIMDGSISANKWNNYIPFEETPFVKNPPRGFVSSANQNSTDTTYPYRYHGYFDDFRGRTLNEALSEATEIEVDQMKNLQNSNFDKVAAELCPLLTRIVRDVNKDNNWTRELEEWDFTYDAQSRKPILFEIWKNNYVDLIWDEIKAEEVREEIELLYPEIWRTISLTEDDPLNSIFDLQNTPEIEQAEDIAVKSLEMSTLIYDSIFQASPDLIWKDYRKVQINHLSRIAAFSESNVDVGGIGTALNAVKETHGPSWRMVVKLSDPVQAWGVYPGGQSGNPGSPFYKNMIDSWAEGSYFPLLHPGKPEELSEIKIMTLNITP